MTAPGRRAAVAAGAGLLGGTVAAASPLLAAAGAAAAAAVAGLVSLPAWGLAAVLVGASFLSGLALPAGGLSIRPEQAAGLLVSLAILPRRGLAPLPGVTLLAALWIGAGLLSGIFFPEPGRVLVHTARLLLTAVPLFALPMLLARREEAERAWDLFLLFSVLEGLAGLAALASHLSLGTTWGVTVEQYLGFAHPHGTLLEPNLLGALSAAGAIALLLRAGRSGEASRTRRLAAVGAAVCLAALLASVTRAAWLALPAAGAAVALACPAGAAARGKRGLRGLAAALVLLALLAGASLLVLFRDRVDDAAASRTGVVAKVAALASLHEDPNVVVRLRSYAAALGLFRESPLAGAGHGAMERIPGAEDATLAWAGNLEVHLLADTGLVGLFLLLGLVVAVASRTASAARSAADPRERGRALERLGALAVLLFCAQATETTWLASFWVVLGLLLSASPGRATGEGRPLRLLFVHPSDELYGSDRVLLELVRRLDRRRFEPRVLLSTDVPYAGRLTARLAADGVPVERIRIGVLRRRILRSPASLGRYLLDVLVSTARIARLLSRERVDVVHANTVTVLPAAFAAVLTGRRLVWHLHEIVGERPGRAALLGLVRLLSDRLVVVSEAARQALGRAGRGESVAVVPNAVPDRGLLPGPSDPPVVAYIGRLSDRKGPFLVLEAAARLAARHPGARWVFEGDEFGGGGDVLLRLVSRATELGIADRVEFRPFREDVTPLMGEALAVVSPSVLPESFGLVLLEAMTAGRAVVASDHGGPRELVVDGETGLLVPPGDAAALARALGTLLDDPGRAAAMGRAARERALARFPIERAVASFEAIYESVAGRAPYATDISAA